MSKRKIHAIFAVLLAIHLALLCVSAYWHSAVPDESAHLVSGLSHWQLGDFSLYRVNPPLARMWATLPIYLLERGQDAWLTMFVDAGDFGRTEFPISNAFVRQEGERFHRLLVTTRCTSAIFSVLAAIICFLWATELYGSDAGWLSAWLWCFSPMVLGFGGLLTPDVPSAAMGVVAIYTCWRWLKTFEWIDALVAGVGLGLAELTKSTWIVLPPLMVLMLVWRIWLEKIGGPRVDARPFQKASLQSESENKEQGVKTLVTQSSSLLFERKVEERKNAKARSAFQLLAIFATALIVLNCGYGCQGSFRRLGDYRFQSLLLASSPTAMPTVSGNRFLGSWMENIPVPFPSQYVIGFDFHKADAEPGSKLAYLRGELREDGWWYYYLYALAIKCTVGGLLLFGTATLGRIWLCVRGQRALPSLRLEYVLWLPLLAVLVLLSYHTGLNKHSRYLLPIFPLAIVWGSQCAVWRNQVAWWSVRTAALCAMLSSLWVYPHSMSYFNECVGGLKCGHEHLLNSNVDWGQDLYFLKREMRRLGWSRIGLAAWMNHGADHLGIDFFAPPVAPGFELALGTDASSPRPQLVPGHYAISVNFVHGYPHSSPDNAGRTLLIPKDGLRYFQEFEPVGMIGGSMLLYDISAEDIRQSPTWGVTSKSH